MTSSPVQVKICGLRTPEDLNAAEGAQLIGVVIDVPDSPRTRTLEQARVLFARAEGRYRTVAVTVDPSRDLLRRLWEEAGADLVQVHGRLPPGLMETERRRIIRSLGVPGPGLSQEVPPLGDKLGIAWWHLDQAGGDRPGGTGKVPDWDLCASLVRSHRDKTFLLAGGLTPENVAAGLETVHPHGVDVASGVESRPGVKSRPRVEAFIQAVRAWEAKHD